ncbi:hypothetical protein ABPG73_008544, partial [Tetrahymena malaccensis]
NNEYFLKSREILNCRNIKILKLQKEQLNLFQYILDIQLKNQNSTLSNNLFKKQLHSIRKCIEKIRTISIQDQKISCISLELFLKY